MISAILIITLGVSITHQCDNICTTNYIKSNDLNPVGCDQTTMLTTACTSMISCASACASNKTCAAFLYKSQPGSCSLCHGDQMQSLNFTSNENFFWPQQVKEKWPLTDPVAKITTKAVSINVTTGTVVHVQGYYYSLDGFNIEFRQDLQGQNRNLHFRPRRVSVPEIAIASFENYVFKGQILLVPTPYPFVENTVTTVDILVTKVGFNIYIDQKFCCSYNHAMPYSSIQYLWINGNIEVYEVRF